MSAKASELYKMIPQEELKRIMSQPYCELEFDFMGFEEVYKAAAMFVPKSKTIIDLGCYLAPQCYFFKDYKKYIGVDNFELSFPMERFKCENTEHYVSSIQNFIQNILPTLSLDLKDCFAICSYVEDENAQKMVRETFPDCLVYYPYSHVL